ncbi:GNAT family protein [Microbispora sp. NBRC 16548]|uniref:GNAT family N-acetyltransferase n=1 Tax=Microbispora sp. NBRC 16548 TaxID=3030994 RepID=UPI0024A0B613|nr:GNAT family protein [Microbispora sp. NBRC 16548]GLX08571.1 N-acetyltransferase [Microbispora sp. NBRC 16548]
MSVEPTRLSGHIIDLEPLSWNHLDDLTIAAKYDDVWTYLDEPTPQTEEPVAALISEAISEQEQGLRLPFAIIARETKKAIGSISYIDIQRKHYAVELGWAWVTPSHWRTGAAREAAYLLIEHAFEVLGAIRVAFKTDSRNIRSQRAISGLGATKEGVFRNHRILRDGHIRHSVYYSIIREEWPSVRQAVRSRQSAYTATQDAH